MIEYLFFLTPKLIYDTMPMSVLVAVLITFGVFTKYNEMTAFKACGVSLYRLAVPVLIASTLLSGGLFAFDHYYIPDANRRQDALRNIIKGRPPQTYLRPDRKWIYGQRDRIYYYKYFDTAESVMVGVSVFELDPKTFRLTRHIQAENAHWEPSLNKWVFENGWSRDIDGIHETKFDDFRGKTMTFPELTEPPSYFVKEVKQYFQMNFEALGAYIRELQQSGFNTVAAPGAVSQEVLGAAVRGDHGADLGTVLVPGGQPRRDGRSRRELCDRHRLFQREHAIRADRQPESASAGSGRMVAGRDFHADRAVFPGAYADLSIRPLAALKGRVPLRRPCRGATRLVPDSRQSCDIGLSRRIEMQPVVSAAVQEHRTFQTRLPGSRNGKAQVAAILDRRHGIIPVVRRRKIRTNVLVPVIDRRGGLHSRDMDRLFAAVVHRERIEGPCAARRMDADA